jgi:hypothetical protein
LCKSPDSSQGYPGVAKCCVLCLRRCLGGPGVLAATFLLGDQLVLPRPCAPVFGLAEWAVWCHPQQYALVDVWPHSSEWCAVCANVERSAFSDIASSRSTRLQGGGVRATNGTPRALVARVIFGGTCGCSNNTHSLSCGQCSLRTLLRANAAHDRQHTATGS